MANKMLIDASHPEETRVVVVKGNRIEEFDFESEHKKQIKGNIYLAKVTRVEPSLQAAFVEYGGNRHGFLAFSEIHPDYYQIPVADRQALVEEDLQRAKEEEEQEERKIARERQPSQPARGGQKRSDKISEEIGVEDVDGQDPSPVFDQGEASGEPASGAEQDASENSGGADAASDTGIEETDGGALEAGDDGEDAANRAEDESADAGDDEAGPSDENDISTSGSEGEDAQRGRRNRRGRNRRRGNGAEDDIPGDEEEEVVEEMGSEDALEEVPNRVSRPPRKQYKIQEVIKRRQILLVQVVKEERGNKGAALTTYLSLAGRYSVLMPNTARGGGISRKITNVADRKRLKDVVRDLEVPRGMGIILRTAGANRTKPEVKRDYEYLMRLWETVRGLTLASTAPALVYEEGSLIKRSIRDLYNKDIDQILVAGEGGYREAKDFMRMLLPSQSKVVQPYREQVPIFSRGGIEAQLDRMLQPHVTLKSGGYIIINQTEALVSIDVNSGRSTREHSVEETALQTNLEAAEEIARQLRLRDLAGLIVIDFIDMDEKRNNRAVEKKIKDCLKDDRARIQVGRISHFGLLEMSRQRIRASVLESTTQACPTCAGIGLIRSNSSLALHVVRSIEEFLQKQSTHDIIVKVPTGTALYVLNEKRRMIDEIERLNGVRIIIQADDSHGHQHVAIEQGAEAAPRPVKTDVVSPLTVMPDEIESEEEAEVVVASEDTADRDAASEQAGGEAEDGGRRRRRRRRTRRDETGEDASAPTEEEASVETAEASASSEAPAEEAEPVAADADDQDGGRKRRRRGRRGNGRRGQGEDGASDDAVAGEVSAEAAHGSEIVETIGNEEGFAAAQLSIGSSEAPVQPSEDADTVTETPDIAAEAVAPVVADEAAPQADAPVTQADEEPVASATAEDGVVQAPVVGEPAVEEPVREELLEPLLTSSETEGETKPKRTGWWSRRGFL